MKKNTNHKSKNRANDVSKSVSKSESKGKNFSIFKSFEMGVHLIFTVSLAIIFVAALEALTKSKSKDLFDAYLMVKPYQSSSDFISFVLLTFFSDIFEPVIISVYTFFTYKKHDINNIHKFVFCSVLLVKMIFIASNLDANSTFDFVLLSLYAVLFFTIAYLPKSKKD